MASILCMVPTTLHDWTTSMHVHGGILSVESGHFLVLLVVLTSSLVSRALP